MQINSILIIGLTWPEPNSTAAGARMLQLIDFFIGQDYQITFASTATETEFSADLENMGVQKVQIRLNHASFDDFIKKLNPDVVLFDRFMVEEQFGWRVAEHVPDAIRILDTEDLHSLRQTRETSFKRNKTFSTNLWLQNDVTKREIASIYRCDLSLIISTYEMELLTEVVKVDESLLLHLPFMLDKIDKKQTDQWLPFEERKHFICIGNGKHAPNIDAIYWLKQEIWPLVRKQLPDTQLHIYGSYLPEKVNQFRKPTEGFYVMGRAGDAKEVIGRARVNLAPLRFGAGIKGKLTDSMQCGTPNITTTIGTEGMHGDYPWSGSIEDDPMDFANAAVEFYLNDKKWEQAQQHGIGIINQLYNKIELGKTLISKMEAIQTHLELHRTQNFVGAMLRHHTTASTKYMAKWIEAKNRE